jgi:hypothetical protein
MTVWESHATPKVIFRFLSETCALCVLSFLSREAAVIDVSYLDMLDCGPSWLGGGGGGGGFRGA